MNITIKDVINLINAGKKANLAKIVYKDLVLEYNSYNYTPPSAANLDKSWPNSELPSSINSFENQDDSYLTDPVAFEDSMLKQE